MNRETELDMLAGDTQRILADTLVTVRSLRPAAAYDPITRKRAVDLDAPEAVGIPAVVDDDEPNQNGDKHTRRRAWIVAAVDLGFAPSRGAIVEEAGESWRVVSVQRMTDRRDWRLVGERIE